MGTPVDTIILTNLSIPWRIYPEVYPTVFRVRFSASFGTTASVTHFTRVTALAQFVARIWFAVPATLYIDDGLLIDLVAGGNTAIDVLSSIFRCWRIPLADEKTQHMARHS